MHFDAKPENGMDLLENGWVLKCVGFVTIGRRFLFVDFRVYYACRIDSSI